MKITPTTNPKHRKIIDIKERSSLKRQRVFSKEFAERNPGYHVAATKKWMLEHPWMKHYVSARRRCVDIKSNRYKYYGGKGIKFLLTSAEIKLLWFRDKAHLMKQPTIDRIETDYNYQYSNCRFIERSLNTAIRNRRQARARTNIKIYTD